MLTFETQINMKKLIHLFLLLILFSCNNDKNDDKLIYCTEVYSIISVKINDSKSNPIILDSFETVLKNSGIEVKLDFIEEEMIKKGYYPIFDDGQIKKFNFEEDIHLNFKGMINNEIVVNEDYIVSFDGCHVYLIEGVTHLIID